jgi:hypothetical protein
MRALLRIKPVRDKWVIPSTDSELEPFASALRTETAATGSIRVGTSLTESLYRRAF